MPIVNKKSLEKKIIYSKELVDLEIERGKSLLSNTKEHTMLFAGLLAVSIAFITAPDLRVRLSLIPMLIVLFYYDYKYNKLDRAVNRELNNFYSLKRTILENQDKLSKVSDSAKVHIKNDKTPKKS